MFAPKTKGTITLTIDVAQISGQLEALRYKKDDIVYFRAFYPNNDPRKAKDKGRKGQTKNLDELVEIVSQFQSEGRGVYFVVNSCGHRNEDITQCRAIFFEHDDLEKELQRELWRSLGLPEPSLQVDTGGKSIHNYWIFNQSITPQHWEPLQTDLLEYANADRSLKNPSRVMRLAGCWHFSPNNQRNEQTKIISNSGKRYSFEELRNLIPFYKAELQGNPPVPDNWADMRKLSQYLEGYKPGGRKGWITCKCPVHGGESYDSLHVNEARGKFHCHSGCDTKEIFRITLDIAKSKGHMIPEKRQSYTPQAIATKSNLIAHPAARIQRIDVEGIKAEYTKLLAIEASQSELESFKIQTRQNYPLLQPSELKRLLNATRDEFDKAENLLNDTEELRKLVESSEQTINLADYLPQSLAKPLTQYCEWQKIRHAVVLTSLLTSVSSLHKVGTEVILHKNLNFAVPPTLYSAIVAESGSKKSPIFRATAKLPLNGLKQSRVDEYLQNLKDYQVELDAWEEENANLKKGEKPRQPKPTEPAQPPIFYFTDGTGEGIKSQAQKAPDKALFLLCDELAGYFASQDKYFSGKGSDKQDLLSYYDGTGATVLRAGGVKVDVPRIYLSILGTIQPDIIKKIMGNTNDLDGSWSRWLFAIQPNIPTTLPDDVPCGVDCTDVMTGYFEKVFDLPLTKYKLSQEAFRIYQPFYNRLEQLRVLYPTPGFRAVYAKAEGLAGRLALNLHILYEFAEGRIPSQVIGSDMMHRAIALMKFYIGQVRMVHAFVNDGDSVAPLLLKVIELSKRNQLAGEEGWIKASDVQKNTTRAKRPSAVEARNWMIQASNLGYGIIRGEGSKIEFRTSLQNSIDKKDKNRQTIDTVSIPETLVIQGVPQNIDKIDDLRHSDTISDDTPHTTILNRQPIDDLCLFGLSNLESIDVASNPTIHSPSIITSIECLSFNKKTQVVMATTGVVMTPQSQSQPEYKVGDRVEFKHPESCNIDWIKGRIDDVNCQQGYFISYTISYLQRGKNSTCKLHRQDWVRVVR